MARFLSKAGLITLAMLIATSYPVAAYPAAAQGNDTAVRDINKIEVNERQLREAVASRTLTWLTGSSSNNDHISVGRMANFFGFVGLRVGSGHSLTRSDVANDTLAVLNDAQRASLIALLESQITPFKQVQTARLAMNRALEGLLVDEPLSEKDFLELGRAYGSSEALLGGVIAQKLGDVAQTLTTEQKAALIKIRAAHIAGKGHEIERSKLKLKIPREQKQELVNIAARFLSWTTGTPQYNDFEVVGKPSQHFGFVSLRKESNHGVKRGDVAKAVMQMLDTQQIKRLDASSAHNVKAFDQFLNARAKLMRSLEVALSGDVISHDDVSKFGSLVGEIEASMTWAQATAMLQVRNTMSDAQTVNLLKLRNQYVAAEDASMPFDSAERGRQLYAQCALCHNAANLQASGPNLVGIVGRDIATEPSFEGYSSALKAYADVGRIWSEAVLDNFLRSPRALVPGTYMGFDGLEQERDRAAIITYLKSL